jgi:peptidoglycan/LPS O-acetylase OafA/YrhL
LCHGLVALIVKHFFGPHSSLPLSKHTLPWCMTIWLGSFIVAWAAYRWWEKPIMNLRDRRRHTA